jgi:hypothetical protein
LTEKGFPPLEEQVRIVVKPACLLQQRADVGQLVDAIVGQAVNVQSVENGRAIDTHSLDRDTT